ncbi:MAG TPA: hypothetical protein PKU97_09235 [Kofleriaceae bacterium]|nr:hypothetical protein [Kofleriaceae bacterium]
MMLALLAEDSVSAQILQTLLARAGVTARPFAVGGAARLPALVEALLASHREVLVALDEEAQAHTALPARARALVVEPSLEAWLTRDPEANLAVLGSRDVPAADQAQAWVRGLRLPESRRFSLALHGLALATRLDLPTLVAVAPGLRSLLAGLHPGWAAEQPIKRGPGRPAGVAIFRGTGYPMCLEFLHRGAGNPVTVVEFCEVLRRTATPIARLLGEGERRGYLRRAGRGTWSLRSGDHLLEDLVTDLKARRRQARAPALGLRVDRDRAGLAQRLGQRLAEHGRVFALTGGPAVAALGGDHLVGGPLLAYASLAGIQPLLGDAYEDPAEPQLILREPLEEGFLHRLVPGQPNRVCPWQAVIDLLASDSERERETGELVRRRMLEAT